MRINEHTAISTPRVLLVPYERRHVLKYHSWMRDPAIQEATASEPLTLEEEYDNQESWRTSHDKLTFIVCHPLPVPAPDLSTVAAGEGDPEEKMVGDINFFIHPCYDDEAEKDVYQGEVDIMIADTANRSKGFGRAAVSAFLYYILRYLGPIMEEYSQTMATGAGLGRLGLIMARIKVANVGSIGLFKSLGFERQGDVNYFGEIKMVLRQEVFARLAESRPDGYVELEYRRLL